MPTIKILANEDKDLQTVSLQTSITRTYKDIDLTFAKNTNTGDIYKKKDAAAVKQAIKNLLLTNNLERPFNASFGANLNDFLFELSGGETAESEIKQNIIRAIEKHEPRAKVLDIEVNARPELNAISVSIQFSILGMSESVTFETTVSRLR
jgi:phage baseplate assembly protein W